jgi:uncharacterized protein (TIGR00269 family)
MIKKNDRIAVGLSGGKDSTVLMHCLHELQKDLPFELIAITIDEGISNYREATLKIAKTETEKLGIELKVVSFKDKLNKTLDTILRTDSSRSCTYCGVFRRGLLNRTAREAGVNKLAVGHNLDDLAQTFLMNVIRAEPSRIARYMDPENKDSSFIQRIRPLLRSPEKEIAIYAMAKGIDIDHRECPYADNAMRQTLRRQLNELEEKYPGSKFKILSSFLEMESKLKVEGPGLKSCITCNEPTTSDKCKFCELIAHIK